MVPEGCRRAEMLSQTFKKYRTTWMHSLFSQIVLKGPTPAHVGIILDGNRRYARMKNFTDLTDGHRIGLENFKRPLAEVTGIMDIITDRMIAYSNELNYLNDKGFRVELIGDWSKMNWKQLKQVSAKVMLRTRENLRFKLNLAVAYTGQNQLATGLDTLLRGLCARDIEPEDLSEQVVTQTFTLSTSTPVDIIIRTGGNPRLSDFMLWSGARSYLNVVDKTWPEFSFWDLIKTIFKFQVNGIRTGFISGYAGAEREGASCYNARVHEFVLSAKNRLWDSIIGSDSSLRDCGPD